MNKNENLRRFNGDKTTKKDLQDYIISKFEEAIVKAAYEGKDVKPLANAAIELNKAFNQLDIDYAIPEETTKQVNQAR